MSKSVQGFKISPFSTNSFYGVANAPLADEPGGPHARRLSRPIPGHPVNPSPSDARSEEAPFIPAPTSSQDAALARVGTGLPGVGGSPHERSLFR